MKRHLPSLCVLAVLAISPSAAFAGATGPAGGDLTGTYPNPQIKAGAITATDIAFGTITSANIGLAAITGWNIDAATIGTREIATDGVGSAEIADNAVGAAEIAADSVGGSEIKPGSIMASDLAAGAGSSAHGAYNDAGAPVGAGAGWTTVLSKDLQPGSYVLLAKAELYTGGQGAVAPACRLIAGGDSDHAQAGLGIVSGPIEQIATPMLMVLHTFSSPGTAQLQCAGLPDRQLSVSHRKLTAIKVGWLGNAPGS